MASAEHPREILVYQALERAIARAAADEAQLVAARAIWDRRAGAVHHDEPLFEERAAAFLEWFVLDAREGGPAPPPPIDRMLAEAADARERAALSALAASHRSVFRVREVREDGLLLDDLWGGALFRTRERRRLTGVTAGELYDARLVADFESPPDLLLTRTFCFHPREAEPAIRDRIARARRAGEPREALLFQLLRLRVRCERYRHVSAARVYTTDDTER